jgi:hypothetical protein
MRRFNLSVLLSVGFLLGSQCALATTLIVGTCRKGTQFSTISAAVAAAPTGATVLVCPGTYPEQVIISTPLNLTGITNGQLDRVIIASPAGGVGTSFTSPIDGAVVAAQVLVTTGPVNITNVTVDGTGNGVSSSWIAGIAYESGASGTVNGVTAREQTGGNFGGVGFWAENANSTSETVTIENSQVRDASNTGILVRSGINPPTLLAKVVGNQMVVGNLTSGMFFGIRGNPAGSIMGNVIIDCTQIGIEMDGFATASVVGNAISARLGDNFLTGIQVGGTGEIVKSNTILGTRNGIDASSASGAMKLEANTITDANNIGIAMACQTGFTISGNIMNDVFTGLNSVPLGVAVLGTYHNVTLLATGGC